MTEHSGRVLRVHGDFTSRKKTLHNAAELTVMLFFFKMLVINGFCFFFLEFEFTGSRKVFKEFKLRLATSIFALLVIIVVTVIELYSTSDFAMPFWICESEMK